MGPDLSFVRGRVNDRSNVIYGWYHSFNSVYASCLKIPPEVVATNPMILAVAICYRRHGTIARLPSLEAKGHYDVTEFTC